MQATAVHSGDIAEQPMSFALPKVVLLFLPLVLLKVPRCLLPTRWMLVCVPMATTVMDFAHQRTCVAVTGGIVETVRRIALLQGLITTKMVVNQTMEPVAVSVP